MALYLDGDYVVWALVAFLLAPDLSFAGYLAGPQVGGRVQRRAHICLPGGPGDRLLARNKAGLPLQIALIWAAHIGIDRVLGYGLKYPSAFKDTHLGRV